MSSILGLALAPRSHIGFVTLLALGGCSLLPEENPPTRGPIATRNQHPLALTVLQPRPRSARIQPRGTLGVELASTAMSIFEDGFGAGEKVVFDGEIWRNALRLRYGLAEGLDVEVEFALAYTTSGFLDGLADAFHDTFNLPGGGRGLVGTDQFEMKIESEDETIFDVEENRLGLDDIPIVLTRRLREEDADGPGVAFRVAVELPTGSEKNGFGNGKLDYGAGILLERSIGKWTFTGGADYVLVGQPDDFEDADVDLDNSILLAQGIEYRLGERCSLLMQVLYQSPFTRDLDIKEIDREMLDLGIGLALDVSGARFTTSIHEDVIASTGTDFVFRFALSWGM